MRTPPLPSGRAAALAGGLTAVLVLSCLPARAETPGPTPTPSATASPTPTPTPSDTATPTPTSSDTATPVPSTTPSATPSAPVTTPARPAPRVDATDPGSLTLQVAADGSPQAGHFFQDLGRYGFSGAVTGIRDGKPVEVYRRGVASGWTKVAAATVVSGTYRASLPVTTLGVYRFSATTGGAPGSGDEVSSPVVTVTVADSSVNLDKPAARVDSLTSPALTGSVVPARPGVAVQVAVREKDRYVTAGKAVTDAHGRFRVPFASGKGHLQAYRVRSTFHAQNRDRWEVSASRVLTRVAVLHAVATDTTKADVAKTYRAGCPVGRSRLQTVAMNYYGRDGLMHRGVLVIRTDLVPEVKRAFGKALAARYPIAKMKNPNDYGGNDPKQMKANNTSGFNCRKVVGNPYAQSPHSYGIAIDLNTVQNPYRDNHGKWWPSNGKSYIDRSPLRKGMLGKSSPLTKQLRSDHFFWGGLWSPGRDYQHFEYRR